MALGITTLLSVVDNGSQSYTFTVSSTAGITVGDHVGTRLSDNSGAIYRVTAVSSPTITVQDDLIEAETGPFGVPDPTVDSGKIGYGTPTAANGFTQLPYSSPGWDAAGRRNNELSDSLGGGSDSTIEFITTDYTITSSDDNKIFIYTGSSSVTLTVSDDLPDNFKFMAWVADSSGGPTGNITISPESPTNGEIFGIPNSSPLLGTAGASLSMQTPSGMSWQKAGLTWYPINGFVGGGISEIGGGGGGGGNPEAQWYSLDSASRIEEGGEQIVGANEPNNYQVLDSTSDPIDLSVGATTTIADETIDISAGSGSGTGYTWSYVDTTLTVTFSTPGNYIMFHDTATASTSFTANVV